MKFSHGNFAVDFSELYDDKTMRVAGYGNGHSISIELNESGIRELRKWLTIQIRKAKPEKKK